MSNQSYFGDENDYDGGDSYGGQGGGGDETEADEQHTQKVNGRMEALEDEIKNLRQDLLEERRSHNQTKKTYETKLHELKEEARAIQSERYLSKEQRAQRKELEDTHKKVRLLEFGPNMIIRNEILKICHKNKVMVECDDASVMDDAMTMLCLKQINKYFRAARKAPSDASATITEGVSDNELVNRIKILESELRMALLAAEDIKALKFKLMQMVDRIRLEKEYKLKVESDMVNIKKKLEMLTDHIEKLMIHLKHEAAAKVRATDQLRISEKEIQMLKDKCENIFRRSSAKDRLIVELREGSKVLEDQLRLMDDKYIELRGKLDHARESGLRRVKQAEKQASELRMKWAMSGNGGSLDNIQLPDVFTGLSWDDNSQDFTAESPHNVGKQTPKKSPKSKAPDSSSSSSSSMSMSSSKPSKLELLFPKQEPSMELINDKLRLQAGHKIKWSDDQIKDLVKPN